MNPASGSKAFWPTFSKLVDTKKPQIAPLLENGYFVSNFECKANLLNDYFITQCCAVETSSTLPQLVANDIPNLQNCEINRTKVLNNSRNLDSSKSHGCDDLSVAMIKLCEISIVEPLCIIVERCVANGVYPSSWKEANSSCPQKRKLPMLDY